MTNPAIPWLESKQLFPSVQVPAIQVRAIEENGLYAYPATESFDDGVGTK